MSNPWLLSPGGEKQSCESYDCYLCNFKNLLKHYRKSIWENCKAKNVAAVREQCSLRKQLTFCDTIDHWFPREVMSDNRVQKFHTDDTTLPRSGSHFSDIISQGNQWSCREMSARWYSYTLSCLNKYKALDTFSISLQLLKGGSCLSPMYTKKPKKMIYMTRFLSMEK